MNKKELRMSAYKGHVRTLLEMELDKYSDRGQVFQKFETGKGKCTVSIYVDELNTALDRQRLRGDILVQGH